MKYMIMNWNEWKYFNFLVFIGICIFYQTHLTVLLIIFVYILFNLIHINIIKL